MSLLSSILMNRVPMALSARGVFEFIWKIFTNRYALGLYVLLLFGLIIAVIAVMISEEGKLAALMEERTKRKSELLSQKVDVHVENPLALELDGFEGGNGKRKQEEEDEPQDPRFYMLDKTDKEMSSRVTDSFDRAESLEEICERFRNFAASRLKLYYDINDIRRFIAGLSVTHILIMQGMSGTGKTSLAYAFGEFLKNSSVIVPIQPMWKERTDLIGYYNEFTKRFNETVLLQKMYEANYNDRMYVTVLDEMNIARVEYYFAEFLSLLELPNPESRYLDVVSDKWDNDPKLLKNGQLRLPPNMWFVGTANNDDSTFSISDKVYDRAMVMNLDKKSDYFEADDTEGMRLSFEQWCKLTEGAQREYGITNRNIRRIRKLDGYMIDKFHITFGNRIMKQIRCYVAVFVACGGDELVAIDDIMSKKVMRKLESQNPVYVRKAADGLCAYLDDLFGQDKMPLCKEAIRRIERNA